MGGEKRGRREEEGKEGERGKNGGWKERGKGEQRTVTVVKLKDLTKKVFISGQLGVNRIWSVDCSFITNLMYKKCVSH